MPERRGTVRLFGKDYRWWREKPGQPLELVPHAPIPEPRSLTPSELYEETMRMMGGMLPWPDEEERRV